MRARGCAPGNEMFDFAVAEMKRREADDLRRIRAERTALKNQHDGLTGREPELEVAQLLRAAPPARGSYPDLLQFFLNHRCFLRRRVPKQIGKNPTQLMAGQDHPHWLSLLGLSQLPPLRA